MRKAPNSKNRARLIGALLLASFMLGWPFEGRTQSNPLPQINQPTVPAVAPPGSPGPTVTVNGTGFVQGATVNWNGSPRATTFVSRSQLTAAILGSDVVAPTTASVTAVNPSPGGGASNVVSFLVTTAVPSVLFNNTAYGTGTGPRSAAVGDFNGDGVPDVAVVSYTVTSGGLLSIFLGNADGAFQPRVDYLAEVPVFVAVGDFNGDGKLDLVTTGNAAGTVSVFLGNGDGTFQAALDSSTGSPVCSLAVGDFNQDGKLDLAVVNDSSNEVSILLGNGNGTFQSPSTIPVGQFPDSVTTGDFNGDGTLDLAVVNLCGNDATCSHLSPDTVSILLGNGDGTFRQGTAVSVGRAPASVATADLNGDGLLDLLLVNIEDADVSVLLGKGDGTFTETTYATVSEPQSVVAGDLNGDGKLDLVAVSFGSVAPELSVLLGNGDGTFQSHVDYATGSGPLSVVAADFNRDGRLDLANVNDFSDTLSVFLQTPGAVVSLSPTSLAFGVAVVGTTGSSQISTLTNTGNQSLSITSVAVAAGFQVRNKCGSSVAAGASCNLVVSFQPQHAGTTTGTLTITDNAPGSPQTVSLTGTGTFFSLSPLSLNFGSVSKGQTSPPQTVTLTNVAKTAQSVSIRLGGTNPGEFAQTNTCGTSLAAGANCSMSVTFTPKFKGPGSATLQVSGGGGGTQNVSLSGTGVS